MGLVSVALALALATPASAAHATMTADWQAPGADPDAGAVVEGTVRADLDVSFSAPIVESNVKEWQVQLRETQGASLGVLCSRGYSGLGTETARVDFTWDSRSHPSGVVNAECGEGDEANVDPGRALANGEYVLRLRAHDQVLITEWHDDDFVIRVNNPPAVPAGVAAAFAPDRQQVDVSWSANPEPDLVGYTVEQCRTDSESDPCAPSDWATVAEHEPGDTEVSLDVADPGAYRYRVFARRPNWSQNATLSSDPAPAGSAVVLDAKEPKESDDDPDDGASTSPTTLPGSGTESGSGSAAESLDVERQRSLEPRLVQRSSGFEAGFDDELPYGAAPVERTRSRADDVLVGPEGGAGNLLVPIAGGLAVFVFAMQLRYLGRRAVGVAAGGDALELVGDDEPNEEASSPSVDDDDDEPVPAFRPLLGGSADDGPGSFIANWKRWLPRDRDS